MCSLPRKRSKIKKMYFNIDTPNGPSGCFKKHAYQLIDNKEVTLIHYIGDETVAVDFSHRGNETTKIIVKIVCGGLCRSGHGQTHVFSAILKLLFRYLLTSSFNLS